jgi:hypothetical protein
MVATAKRSASAEAAKRARQAAIMALSPIDRMKRALQAGETARAFARMGAESRERKHSK